MGTEATSMIDFGTWSLHPDCRELRVDGVARDMEPKAFELLLFLIEERPRVVLRHELLDRVWGGADVSENVLARTVMKARRAMGERADGRSLIRTVHRVGYRFVGEQVRAGAAQAPAGGPMIRVGLLPFENLSGSADLAWVEQGLAAVVTQALEDDSRLSVLPPTALARALPPRGAAPDEPPAEQALRLFGLDCAVQVQVLREGGQFHLDFQGVGSHGQGLHGRISGDDLTVLAQALADRIERRLFPQAPQAVPLQSTDAFVNQALARALQACAEERWQSAAKLLQVVLDFQPGSLAAAAQYLSVLAALYDPAAFDLGERLLRQAGERGDDRVAVAVHQALGHARLNIEGPNPAADRHMETALALASQHGQADWVLRACLTRARYEHLKRDDDKARELYAHAARLCQAAGNRVDLAKIMNNRAVLDAMNGNLLGARECMTEAVRLSEELRLDSNVMASGSNLAVAHAELGFMGQAVAQCDALAGRIGTLQDARLAGGVAVSLCSVYADLWAVQKIAPLIEALRQRPDSRMPQLQPFIRMCEGHQAVAAGRPGEASPLMGQAIQDIAAQGDALMPEQWLPVHLRCALMAGLAEEAEALTQRLMALPSFAESELLQGLVTWARGVIRHAAGDDTAARDQLMNAVRALPTGRWNALARLDLAWLDIERGEMLPARHLLRDIAPWLEEHPAGWLTQARFKAAQHDLAQARALLERLRAQAPVDAACSLAVWITAEGPLQGPDGALPGASGRAPRLPSCL